MLGRKKRDSILGWMLVLIFIISMMAPAINPIDTYASGTAVTLEEAMEGIVSYYVDNKTSLDSWEEVLGLTNAGVDLSDDPWQLPDWDVDALDTDSSSPVTYSSTILALKAIGQDPGDFNGRNLVSELASMQLDSGAFSGSINNTIWSIIALDTSGGDYEVIEAVNYLLAQQTNDGGFVLSGDSADPDITGVALLALAPHTSIDAVNAVINQAKECLNDLQLDSGGFSSGVENTESIASVIRGLNAIDEDITSGIWTKNGNTMIDALFAFQKENHAFSHISGGNKDDIATRQALIAVSDLVNGNVFYSITQNGGTGGPNEDPVRVRVRVEGATASLHDSQATVSGTALDALKVAVGNDNVVAPEGFLTEIRGESGANGVAEGINTSWHYYVIRDGNIEWDAFSVGAGTYNVEDGDQIIFYIGADDAVTWASKTYFPIVSVNPASPSAGQTVTISISAQKYDWESGLEALSGDEASAIGDYTVKIGDQENISAYGQVILTDVAQGTLEYSISNANAAGYPDVVTYKASVNVGAEADSTVRVRVEGAADSLHDSQATVSGTALDALNEAVGSANVVAPREFITGILGETGKSGVATGIDTSWHYYVIRDGNIEEGAFSVGSGSYNVEDGDQVIFYIGAYDADTYADKTYFPIVSVNPASPSVGQPVTINISARKYDWGSGLQDLSGAEASAIGDYTVNIGEQEYTSTYGQVMLSDVVQGTLEYSIINANAAGYPDVVTYKGSISVGSSGGGNSGGGEDKTRVYIAVVGSEGELLFSPNGVNVDPRDTYGLTAVAALDATGLSWSYTPGLVTEIEGQKNEGVNGWMCKINNAALSVSAFDSAVKDGAKVIWWYSYDPNSNGPEWGDLSSGGVTVPSKAVTTALAESIEEVFSLYPEQLEQLQDKTSLINADKRMTAEQVNALQKELDKNTVSLKEKINQERTIISDMLQEIVVLIPAHALSGTATITIQELSPDKSPQQFALRIGSSVYQFGPDGSKFNEPLTICIKMAITQDMDVTKLSPAWYDSEKKQWITIPALIDLESGRVLFKIDHFTDFAVVELPSRISFPDVKDNIAWAREAIEVLAAQEIIKGTGQGFEPDRNISRAEFVQLMVKALELTPASDAKMNFKDVKAEDWFADVVDIACANSIIKGYPDATFRPNKPITRNEIASVLKRLQPEYIYTGSALNYVDQKDIPAWAMPAVKFTYQTNLMAGYADGSFKGDRSLTRAEAAVTIYRYLNYLLVSGYKL